LGTGGVDVRRSKTSLLKRPIDFNVRTVDGTPIIVITGVRLLLGTLNKLLRRPEVKEQNKNEAVRMLGNNLSP